MKRLIVISVLLVIGPMSASARIFDLGRERFASYLMLGYSMPQLKDGAFGGAEGTATTYSESVTTMTSGEFGFAYATKYLTWTFGFEILMPQKLLEVEASNNGAAVYSVGSQITNYVPKVGLELNFRTTSSSRLFAFASYGQASVTVDNTYTSLTVAPNSDFAIQYKGAAVSTNGGVGFEFAAFDTTSFLIAVGYRDLLFDELTYGTDVTTSFDGAHNAGDKVLRADGTARDLNYRGVFAVFGARFWLF